MAKNELFSFILSSDFSSFRKFDSGGDFYLTYYFIPRPTVLGILGSVIGLEKSSRDKLPWWEELKSTKIAIEPLFANPMKHLVVYNNTTGAASYDDEKRGQTLNIREQILLGPQYRIYVEFNEKTEQIFNLLSTHKSVFTPYLGKNEFRAEISDLQRNFFTFYSGVSKINSIYPFCSAVLKEPSSLVWINQNKNVQILENHPYTYDSSYRYIQELFVYSSNEVNTEIINNKRVNGVFVQLDNKKVIYLYGDKK